MAEIKHIQYYSNILNVNLNLEITGNWGYPILLFPTSHGSYLQNRDFGLNSSVMKWVDEGKIKLYNIESIDGLTFYNKDFSTDIIFHNYELYVQFLRHELVPYIQNECQTHRIAIGGCSFGGYHASNFAFRFPDLISHLFSLSGAFSSRSFAPNSNNDLVYFNSPEEFMPNEEAWKYNHMHIVLSTSDQDICLGKNQNMAKILSSKGINYWYDEKKWISHDWPLWRMVFPEFIGAFF